MKLLWPLLMIGLLFTLSSIPGTSGSDGYWLADILEPNFQNALHVPLYATLQILWLRTLAKPERSMLMTITMALIFTCSYGIIDEFHQSFVPGRYASVLDVLLNSIGAFLGAAIYWLSVEKKRTRTHGTLF